MLRPSLEFDTGIASFSCSIPHLLILALFTFSLAYLLSLVCLHDGLLITSHQFSLCYTCVCYLPITRETPEQAKSF